MTNSQLSKIVEKSTAQVSQSFDQTCKQLIEFLKIPSISAAPQAIDKVNLSAQFAAELLKDAGMTQVQILTATCQDGSPGMPAVLAHRHGTPGAPTVLLYAHHDVQPVIENQWTTDPFEPTIRENRLFARGSSDDKGGLLVHVNAIKNVLSQWAENEGPSITVFVEGEEEIGSPSMANFLAEHRDILAADIMIVADAGNWSVTQPALTTTLRGMVDLEFEIKTLKHGVHSGVFGGPAMDAMTATVLTLAKFWDDAGDLAVPGLHSGGTPQIDYTEAEFREHSGLLPGVELMGTGSIAQRLWQKPALTVIGMDTTATKDASNTLIPAVKTRISMRTAPGENPNKAKEALIDHLQHSVPYGARLEILKAETGQSYSAEAGSQLTKLAGDSLTLAWQQSAEVEACGVKLEFSEEVKPVCEIGMGGSIPLVAEYQKYFPDATILLLGVFDPQSRPHGPDESLDLSVFFRACLAQTMFLQQLGQA